MKMFSQEKRIILCSILAFFSGFIVIYAVAAERVPRLARPFGGGDLLIGPDEGRVFGVSVAIALGGMLGFGAQLVRDARILLAERSNRANGPDS